MRRQLFASSVVFLLIGFILGFFVNQAVRSPKKADSAGPSSASLPENHPAPELLERLDQLLEHVRNHPEDRKSLVQLGNSFYDIGRFDAAVEWYEKALALQPADIDVSTDLGTSYLYTGRREDALRQFQKSLDMDPNHAQTLQNIGVAYFAGGEYKEAVRVWEQLIGAHPDYVRAEEIREQIKTAKLHFEQQAVTQ